MKSGPYIATVRDALAALEQIKTAWQEAGPVEPREWASIDNDLDHGLRALHAVLPYSTKRPRGVLCGYPDAGFRLGSRRESDAPPKEN